VDEVLDDLRGRRIFRLEDFQAGRFSGAGQEIGKVMTKQLNIWPHTVSPGCDASACPSYSISPGCDVSPLTGCDVSQGCGSFNDSWWCDASSSRATVATDRTSDNQLVATTGCEPVITRGATNKWSVQADSACDTGIETTFQEILIVMESGRGGRLGWLKRH
jgi:hypothetical protein